MIINEEVRRNKKKNQYNKSNKKEKNTITKKPK